MVSAAADEVFPVKISSPSAERIVELLACRTDFLKTRLFLVSSAAESSDGGAPSQSRRV